MRKLRNAKRPSGVAEEAAAVGCQRSRLRRETILTAVLVMAVISLIAVSTYVKLFAPGPQPQGPTAAIVDQLSLTFPNPGFAETATRTLEEAGFAVDYYPGEQVTVGFYRNLPTRGYDFLVLRTHSALSGRNAEATDDASLYTTEPYDETKYLGEQAARRLTIGSYYEGGPEYFALPPDFIRSSTRGRFEGTVVILMGCDGLRSDAAAQAFVEKGAEAVVSWNGPISTSYTDAATERLLQHLLPERLSVQQAVAKTMAEVGPDPGHGSSLLYYPRERHT